MQVDGRVDLRPHDRAKPFLVQRGDQAVVEDAGRMHHTPQRELHRHQRQRLRQFLTNRRITRRHLDRRPRSPQLRDQLHRTIRRQPTTTRQHQRPHPIPLHQMPRQQPTQHTRTTRNQHRPRRIHPTPRTHTRTLNLKPALSHTRLHPGPHQTRHHQPTTTHRHLRLIKRKGGCKGRRHRLHLLLRIGLRVEVDQHQPPGVLRLGRTHQTPHRRVRQAGHPLVRPGGHRTPGHHDQAGIRETLIRQPALHRVEHPRRSRVHDLGQLPADLGLRSSATDGQEHHGRHILGSQLVELRNVPYTEDEPVFPEGYPRLRRRDRVGLVRGEARGGPFQPEGDVADLGAVGSGSRQLLGGHRPNGQRGHRRHRSARGVREVYGQRVLTQRQQPHPRRRGPHGQQGDAGPGERQTHFSPGPGSKAVRVKGGVEECRVNSERRGRPLRVLGQRDLGEDLLTTPPGRAQPLEHGAVPVPGLGELRVELGHVDGLRALRRPHRQVRPHHRIRRLANQHTLGMADPCVVYVGVLATGVHAHVAAPGAVRCGDNDLHLHPAAFR